MILIVRRFIVINTSLFLLFITFFMCDIRQKFGICVRQHRKRKGWSQEQFALECDLDRTYIGGIERGERNVSLINIEKIAIALEIKPKELLEFE